MQHEKQTTWMQSSKNKNAGYHESEAVFCEFCFDVEAFEFASLSASESSSVSNGVMLSRGFCFRYLTHGDIYLLVGRSEFFGVCGLFNFCCEGSEADSWPQFCNEMNLAIVLCTTSGRIKPKSYKLTRWRMKLLKRPISMILDPYSSTKVWQAIGSCTSPTKLQRVESWFMKWAELGSSQYGGNKSRQHSLVVHCMDIPHLHYFLLSLIDIKEVIDHLEVEKFHLKIRMPSYHAQITDYANKRLNQAIWGR